MWKEFKDFALKGNVLDLAVGLIIGAAFGKLISSVVNDLLMPPLGKIVGNVDFKDLFINLSKQPYNSLAAAKAAGVPTVNYGLFLNNVVDFFIIAAAVFLLVRSINKVVKKAAVVSAAPTAEVQLLTEIRDLLRKKP